MPWGWLGSTSSQGREPVVLGNMAQFRSDMLALSRDVEGPHSHWVSSRAVFTDQYTEESCHCASCMQQKDHWLGRRETWFTIWSLKCIISPPNLEKLPFTNTSSVRGNTSIVIPLALQELLWSHNLMYVTCSEYPVYTHRHQHLWTKGSVLCGQTYMARPQFCYITPCFVSSAPTRLQLWNVRNTQLSVFFFWMWYNTYETLYCLGHIRASLRSSSFIKQFLTFIERLLCAWYYVLINSFHSYNPKRNLWLSYPFYRWGNLGGWQ